MRRTTMRPPRTTTRAGLALAAVVAGATVAAQTGGPAPIAPLRTAPTEALVVAPGNRDLGPSTIAGTAMYFGGPTGRGGLFAADTRTGRLLWQYRPADLNGSVSTAPAVAGDLVLAPFGAANPGAVIAVSRATGREAWRGPDPAVGASVAAHEGLAYVLAKDGRFHALEAATGRAVWSQPFLPTSYSCVARPIVRDGTVYVAGLVEAGHFLFALDARTGAERWRYRAEAPPGGGSVCVRDPVVTGDTVYAAGEHRLHAVDRTTGRDRWPPVEVRRVVNGDERGVNLHGLVDAGSAIVALSRVALLAFDTATGRTLWEVPGAFAVDQPCTAVAGTVLYFQGSPASRPAPRPHATLHALDLDTRAILWSFSRPTDEPNWPFGAVTPVDGGLWVDSYKALVKLQ